MSKIDWIKTSDRLPELERTVLVLRCGEPRIASRFIEEPTYEETFKAFWYWDDPHDYGQCWENDEVTHWLDVKITSEGLLYD